MDFSEIESRSVAEFRMEIFITNKFVQFTIGDSDSYYGLVFLSFEFWV